MAHIHEEKHLRCCLPRSAVSQTICQSFLTDLWSHQFLICQSIQPSSASAEAHRPGRCQHISHIKRNGAYLSWRGTTRKPSRSRGWKTAQLPFPDSKWACQLGTVQWDTVWGRRRRHYPVLWMGNATHYPVPQTSRCRTWGTPGLCPRYHVVLAPRPGWPFPPLGRHSTLEAVLPATVCMQYIPISWGRRRYFCLLTDIGNVLAWLCPSSPTKAGFCCNVFMLILQSVREKKSSVSCQLIFNTNWEFLTDFFTAELWSRCKTDNQITNRNDADKKTTSRKV